MELTVIEPANAQHYVLSILPSLLGVPQHVPSFHGLPTIYDAGGCMVESVKGHIYIYHQHFHLVGGFNPSEKYEFVSRDADIPS